MNMNEFTTKLASIAKRGSNLAEDVQLLITVAIDQMKQHRNADYTARLLNGLNGMKLDIRRDVRAYITDHAPVVITFSKTEGYHAKMDTGSDFKELKVPYYQYQRAKNDAAEVDANKLIQTVNNLANKYATLGQEDKLKVKEIVAKKFGFNLKEEVQENI